MCAKWTMGLEGNDDVLSWVQRAMVAAALIVMWSSADARAQVMRQCITDAQATVPGFVLGAATSGTLADFASALAEAGVCAGFVVSDDVTGEVTRAWRYESREPAVRLGDAIDAVQRRHPGIVIQRGPSVLLVRDTRVEVKQSPLARTLTRFELHEVRASEALRRAIDHIAPGSAPAGGRPGSYLSRPGEPPPSRDDLEGPVVTTVLTDATLLDALVDIGGRAPGVVWLLRATTSPNSKERLYQLMVVMHRGSQQLIGSPFR